MTTGVSRGWGAYVHVPFCTRRCPYCAFVLVESDGTLHGRYVDRVCREIRESPYRPERIATLYFGGGTPSLLLPDEVARIADLVRPEGEFTLEANPEDVTLERLRGYARAGANRISLGIQALDDGDLARLGRSHSAADARRAFETAREIFENVSVDVIFGLPGQDWDRALDLLLRWEAPHVSLYGLTYEKGTRFTREVKKDRIRPIPAEEEAVMYRTAMGRLRAAGYRQYELSNFAKPRFESVHNIGYWEGRAYLGFGPGAHSYVPHARWWNMSNVRRYLECADPVMKREELSEDQRMLERVFLGLRRDEGVDLLAFQEEFGIGLLTRSRHEVAELEALGKVAVKEGRLKLTEEGKLIADEVIGRFA